MVSTPVQQKKMKHHMHSLKSFLGVLIILASIFGDVMAGGPITYLQNLSSQGNFQAGVIFLIGAILIYVFIRVVNPSFEPKIKKRQKKLFAKLFHVKDCEIMKHIPSPLFY